MSDDVAYDNESPRDEWTLVDEIIGRFKATFRIKRPADE